MIDRKRLLKDGKYCGEIISYIIFAILGIGVFFLAINDANGYINKIMSIIVVGGLFLVPFGYFMGVKRLIRVLMEIYYILTGKFHIVEKKVLGVQMFSSSSKEVLLVFSNDKIQNIWISHGQAKNYKIDDICYLFYLEEMTSNHGKNKPFAIYNKRNCFLTEELSDMVKRCE